MSLVSIRKKGYLYKLPVKGIVKRWNKRWFVLHSTTIEGIVRLEYFDSDEYEATCIGKRTISLRECSNISPTTGTKTHPYVFQFTSHMGHHVFAADTHTEMEEWMSAIHDAVQEDRRRDRRKKTQSMILQPSHHSVPMPGTLPVALTLKEEGPESVKNELYEPCSSGVYRVTLEQNESAQKLKFTSTYNLEITPAKITLVAANSGAEMAVWKYKHLRTYGKAHGKFNFECGRSSETGAGTFIFNTTCAKEIFGVVHRNIKQMRVQIEQEAQERVGMQMAQTSLPKQQSVPSLSQPHKAASTKPSAKHQRQQPAKPAPYKKKKGSESMSVGTYRLSKEFDSPPSYEEIAAAGSAREEEKEKDKSLTNPMYHEEEEAAKAEGDDPLYASVDKSKKKRAPGLPPRFYTEDDSNTDSAEKKNEFLNPFSGPIASNDPFAGTAGANLSDQPDDSLDNPFQIDPFSSPTQFGSTELGTDPFAIPPLLGEGGGQTAGNVFDTFDHLEGPAGNTDVFNLDQSTSQVAPSSNGLPLLPTVVENPMDEISNPTGIDFDVDLLDDRLFDTLAELEMQDNGSKENLAGGSQPGTLGHSSSPPPSASASATGAATGKKPMSKKLSQKEFDDIWDGICATLPTD